MDYDSLLKLVLFFADLTNSPPAETKEGKPNRLQIENHAFHNNTTTATRPVLLSPRSTDYAQIEPTLPKQTSTAEQDILFSWFLLFGHLIQALNETDYSIYIRTSNLQTNISGWVFHSREIPKHVWSTNRPINAILIIPFPKRRRVRMNLLPAEEKDMTSHYDFLYYPSTRLISLA